MTHAEQEYERTRNQTIRNILGSTKKHKNQHATTYYFPDHSEVIVFKNRIAWRYQQRIQAMRQLST